MKMKDRNQQLRAALGGIADKERVQSVANIPAEDTTNIAGGAAYLLDDEIKLLAMLNTVKLEPQFYRSENQQMKDLQQIIEKVASKDPYFVCQAIVWSRCIGSGMRSINHLAAALVSPFISGQEYAKRFYSAYNKKIKGGGCIYRPDDMSEIKDIVKSLTKVTLTNAMKKGFASVIENLDAYQLTKYKKSIIDISNLCHPVSKNSKAEINGKKVLDLLMKGESISADTWEVAQSEAGQEVAKAVKSGKITKEEGAKVLAEAKKDNWKSLLKEGKLGILAAVRNIRNILTNPDSEIIDLWCKLITTPNLIRKSLINPFQLDLAFEAVNQEFNSCEYTPQVKIALQKGFEMAVPNLASILPGKTCVIVDCSGSMGSYGINIGNKANTYLGWNRSDGCNSVAGKAGLIAATITKATGADIIQFGSYAEFVKMSPYMYHMNVYELGKKLANASQGCTWLHTVFKLLTDNRKVYDRLIIVSDNAINGAVVSNYYKEYVHDVCNPYIYAIDLAAYGTQPLKNEKMVNYYFGYNFQVFDDIANKEFNPLAHLDEVRKVKI